MIRLDRPHVRVHRSYLEAHDDTFGVNEQLIFPEIDYDRVDITRGMDITIVTSVLDTTAAGRC